MTLVVMPAVDIGCQLRSFVSEPLSVGVVMVVLAAGPGISSSDDQLHIMH